jgi:hypothetical protein
LEPVRFAQHFRVTEAHYLEAFSDQPCVTLCISLRTARQIVHAAIDFHDQPPPQAYEIGTVVADLVLAPEREAFGPQHAQLLPCRCFAARRFAHHPPRGAMRIAPVLVRAMTPGRYMSSTCAAGMV